MNDEQAKPPAPALRKIATVPDAPASKRASERPGPVAPDGDPEPAREG